jgi:hypothetical protein
MEEHMQRLITLALVVLALVAVPAAFADDTAPAAPAEQQATNDQAHHPGAFLRLRMKIVAQRFQKRCETRSERCLELAQKVEERLAKLDEKVQARIAKIQETCTATSTDDKCKNADERIARLQKVDEHIKAFAAKVHAWLSGTAASDTTLDQAASDLGKLAGSNG